MPAPGQIHLSRAAPLRALCWQQGQLQAWAGGAAGMHPWVHCWRAIPCSVQHMVERASGPFHCKAAICSAAWWRHWKRPLLQASGVVAHSTWPLEVTPTNTLTHSLQEAEERAAKRAVKKAYIRVGMGRECAGNLRVPRICRELEWGGLLVGGTACRGAACGKGCLGGRLVQPGRLAALGPGWVAREPACVGHPRPCASRRTAGLAQSICS